MPGSEVELFAGVPEAVGPLSDGISRKANGGTAPGPLALLLSGTTNMCPARITNLMQNTNQNQQAVRKIVYSNSTTDSNFFPQISSRPIEQRVQQWDHTAGWIK
jgi:hypothetical protein